MKKAILLSALASLVVTTYAAEPSVQSQIDDLKSKIEALQKVQASSHTEMEDRVDKVETASMVNKINWGVDFRTRVDSFKQTAANEKKSSNDDVWSNRLRLNMSSTITDDMKFTGRLVMYKNWADSYAYPYAGMDPMQGRRPSDSTLFVDRAYVDWTVLKGEVPVALTIGRQPSSDGPSHQFKDNTVRKSTYSALSFDGGADGVVATVGLQKLTGIPELALRVGYGKGYQQNTGASYTGAAGISDTKVGGIFLDAGLGITGSLVQISAVKATDVVSNSNMPNQNKNIGEVSLYTAMVEFTNLANSNLDLFAHYAVSVSKPNGQNSTFSMDTNGDGTPDYFPVMGLLTNNDGNTDTKTGHAFWVGGRYTFESALLNNPRVGLEYNRGSQNWFSFTQGSNDVTNKLATRGDAVEAYYIQPVNRYAYLRVGAQVINYDYSGSGMQIGAPTLLTSPGYGNQLDKLTNYYLLFNVNY